MLLQKDGWTVGSMVKLSEKPDEDECTVFSIASMNDDKTELKYTGRWAAEKNIFIDTRSLADKYRISQSTLKVEEKLDFSNLLATSKWIQTKSPSDMISLALASVWKRFKGTNGPESVTIYTKPVTVFANKDFSKGALALVPFTKKIITIGHDEKEPNNKMELAKLDKNVRVFIGKSNSNDGSFTIPFWMERQEDSDETNMAFSCETVDVWVGDTCTPIKMPNMTNTRQVSKGDKLICEVYDCDKVLRAAKRRKTK